MKNSVKLFVSLSLIFFLSSCKKEDDTAYQCIDECLNGGQPIEMTSYSPQVCGCNCPNDFYGDLCENQLSLLEPLAYRIESIELHDWMTTNGGLEWDPTDSYGNHIDPYLHIELNGVAIGQTVTFSAVTSSSTLIYNATNMGFVDTFPIEFPIEVETGDVLVFRLYDRDLPSLGDPDDYIGGLQYYVDLNDYSASTSSIYPNVPVALEVELHGELVY